MGIASDLPDITTTKLCITKYSAMIRCFITAILFPELKIVNW